MSFDPHAFKRLCGAGCYQTSAFQFHHAETAGTVDAEVAVIAKCRDVDVSFTSESEDVALPFPQYRAVVYIYIFIHGSSP